LCCFKNVAFFGVSPATLLASIFCKNFIITPYSNPFDWNVDDVAATFPVVGNILTEDTLSVEKSNASTKESPQKYPLARELNDEFNPEVDVSVADSNVDVSVLKLYEYNVPSSFPKYPKPPLTLLQPT
jgi:hypothetical protein